jgi:hypothetical protein
MDCKKIIQKRTTERTWKKYKLSNTNIQSAFNCLVLRKIWNVQNNCGSKAKEAHQKPSRSLVVSELLADNT